LPTGQQVHEKFKHAERINQFIGKFKILRYSVLELGFLPDLKGFN
jgi:hypothetical protein